MHTKAQLHSLTGSVLLSADKARNACTFLINTANHVTRTLRSDHDDIDICRRLDIAEVDIEAMSESERIARVQVRSDALLVDLCLLLVGSEDHDKICFLCSISNGHDLEACFFSSLPGLGTFTQTNAHVATRILQIQRMSMTLRAIADNGDLLTLDELGICVLLVIDGYSHVLSLLLMTDVSCI